MLDRQQRHGSVSWRSLDDGTASESEDRDFEFNVDVAIDLGSTALQDLLDPEEKGTRR
jgi:hypothetical protein